MSIFLDEAEIKQVVTSAITEHHAIYTERSISLADRITKAVTQLLELKALQAVTEAAKEAGVAKAQGEAIYHSLTREQLIRERAYEIAISSLNGATVADSTMHGLAADIAERVTNGHPRTKVTPDVPDFQKFIDDIFGRNEWRREGWNDARARMIRSINEQLKQSEFSHILAPFKTTQLKIIRDFIGSFKFDPAKP